MTTRLSLRTEKPEDRGRVATLIARTYLADGARTIEMAARLRAHSGKTLCVVGDTDGEAQAFALFLPIRVGAVDNAAVLMAPFATDTYNEALDLNSFFNDALSHVEKAGYRYVLMHGDPQLYADEGFVEAAELGIRSDVRYPGAVFLVKDLTPGQPANVSGKVDYPAFLNEVP